ncbi:MAG TPA: 16S rRNA (adenine(1518)-N(6)/adenine(1519)-N(6))-dimethyltransferase RsmA [bacterium]|nr:16S rRNA (adenine(1518)-N(6)/adenine(1519)-N(6))-dimethyltransferase RsmA [bacterium]
MTRIPVRQLLERYEIAPRKRFGQNFLHDPAVCERIAAAAGVAPGDAVLEIGPGLGAITAPLLDAGARVTAVEVDRRVADCLDDLFADRTDFLLHRGDVLRLDLSTLAPEARTLVANLPYSITGPVLSRLIDHADRFDRCVIMVQREVGARLVAEPGSRALGAPAVLLRLLWRIERCFEVGKGAFLPPPEVVSVVLRLTRRPGTELAPGLREAVNLAYRQRRKTLRRTLAGVLSDEEGIVTALSALGHPAGARPEHLAPEDWPALLARTGSRP